MKTSERNKSKNSVVREIKFILFMRNCVESSDSALVDNVANHLVIFSPVRHSIALLGVL